MNSKTNADLCYTNQTPKMEDIEGEENGVNLHDKSLSAQNNDVAEHALNSIEEVKRRNIEPSQNQFVGLKMDAETVKDSKEMEDAPIAVEDEQGISISAEDYLLCTMDVYIDSIIIFIKEKDHVESMEVISVIETYLESSYRPKEIVLLDVEEVSQYIVDFENYIIELTGKNLPLIFYKKRFVGDYSDIINANMLQRVDMLLDPPPFPYYNIAVIGGGTEALSVINELENRGLNMSIALVDWVTPSEHNKDRLMFGLGPFSQGHIPTDLLRDLIQSIERQMEAENLVLGGKRRDRKKLWEESLNERTHYANYLNWTYRKLLLALNVQYYNGKIQFLGSDYINIISKEDGIEKSENIAAMCYIICGGSVPRTPKFPGKEFCLTVDTFLFEHQLPSSALIIANTPLGFGIANLLNGYYCKVMIMTDQKVWLPDCDQKCTKAIVADMKECGISLVMVKSIDSVLKLTNTIYLVSVSLINGRKAYARSNVVITDYGREPASSILELEEVGIRTDSCTKKIIVDNELRTSINGIWAFGETVHGHLESTNFITAAAKRVIASICEGEDRIVLPKIEPTVVLAPVEYAFVGETLETALLKNKDRIKVYESDNLEYILYRNAPSQQGCFTKIICLSLSDECLPGEDEELIIGVHALGKNATQFISGFLLSVERTLNNVRIEEFTPTQSSRESGSTYTGFEENSSDTHEVIDAFNKESELVQLQASPLEGSSTGIQDSISISDKDNDDESIYEITEPFEWNEEDDDPTTPSRNVSSEDSINEISQPRFSADMVSHMNELIRVFLHVTMKYDRKIHSDEESTHDLIEPFEWHDSDDPPSEQSFIGDTSFNLSSPDELSENSHIAVELEEEENIYGGLNNHFMEMMELAYIDEICQVYSLSKTKDEILLSDQNVYFCTDGSKVHSERNSTKTSKQSCSQEGDQIKAIECNSFEILEYICSDQTETVYYSNTSNITEINSGGVSTDNVIEKYLSLYNQEEFVTQKQYNIAKTCRIKFSTILSDIQIDMFMAIRKIEFKSPRSLLKIYSNQWNIRVNENNTTYGLCSFEYKSWYQVKVGNLININHVISVEVSGFSEKEYGKNINSLPQDSYSFTGEASQYIEGSELCLPLSEKSFKLLNLESQDPDSKKEQ